VNCPAQPASNNTDKRGRNFFHIMEERYTKAAGL